MKKIDGDDQYDIDSQHVYQVSKMLIKDLRIGKLLFQGILSFSIKQISKPLPSSNNHEFKNKKKYLKAK